MPYFKDAQNNLYFLEEGVDRAKWLPESYVAISDEAAAILQAPTPEQIAATYAAAVQLHMDAAAVAAGYDDIKTAVTYAEEPAVARFQTEGAAFRAWRSLCWDYCYTQLAAVQSATRTQPTVAELIAELPALVLP